MSKSVNWCFTINNYTDEECKEVVSTIESFSRYGVVGKEIGESGTPHLQGYVQFSQRRRRQWIVQQPGFTRAYLTVSRGTPEQAADYCKKGGDILVEFGCIVRPGQRTDLQEIKESLDQGLPMRSLAESHFSKWLVYRKSFEAYRRLRDEPRDFRTQVCWIYGPPGCGKSRLAFDEASYFSNGNFCSLADVSLKWFEPYGGHKVVIIDDFKGQAEISVLLRLWDRYPMQVPVKGAFVEWMPRIVYVTSNYHPFEFYSGEGPSYDALLRRIDDIKHVTL